MKDFDTEGLLGGMTSCWQIASDVKQKVSGEPANGEGVQKPLLKTMQLIHKTVAGF